MSDLNTAYNQAQSIGQGGAFMNSMAAALGASAAADSAIGAGTSGAVQAASAQAQAGVSNAASNAAYTAAFDAAKAAGKTDAEAAAAGQQAVYELGAGDPSTGEGTGGFNAGVIYPRVYFLDKSPFGNVRRQEQCTFLSQEIVPAMPVIQNIVPLPHPINGIRIEEDKHGYDNYLIDGKGNRLESSVYISVITYTDPNTGKQVKQKVSVDFDTVAAARARLNDLAEQKKVLEAQLQQAQASSSSTQTTKAKQETQAKQDQLSSQLADSENQKAYFTWQITDPLVQSSDPRQFNEAPQFDNKPEWTYILLPRPSGKKDKINLLTPWQKKNPPDRSKPIHWGVRLNTGQPFNQPFEVTYYYCFRDPALADLSPAIQLKYDFRDRLGNSLNESLNLTKSIYFVIEIGKNKAGNHFLILFKNGAKPQFFQVGTDENPANPQSQDNKTPGATDSGKAGTGKMMAILKHTYNVDEIENNLFKDKEMTVSVESAGGDLFIRCNAFGDIPWIIHPDVQGKGIAFFIDEELTLYGGNIQAGFAYRPIQYFSTGVFACPDEAFEAHPDFDASGAKPNVSVSNKGPSDVQQEAFSRTQKDANNRDISFSERLMVDAEYLKIANTAVNTQSASTGDSKSATSSTETLIESLMSKQKGLADMIGKLKLNRKISISADKPQGQSVSNQMKSELGAAATSNGFEGLDTKNITVSTSDAFGTPIGIIAIKTGQSVAIVYRATAILTASDVVTNSKWVIKNGRSPYIWMVRMWIDAQTVSDPSPKYDVTCDVMDINLSWNSTGPGEINCTGSMRILEKPRTQRPSGGMSGPQTYQGFLDKVTYVVIEVERKNSVIKDPDAKKRIFTGCIVGADVIDEPGRKIINFKLEDYMFVLQSMKFNLSPFYDGMYYNLAVADIVNTSGFPLRRMWCDGVNIMAASLDAMPSLPCKSLFDEPKYRFKDGSSYKDAIVQIAKMDWRIVYFDGNGDFHFDLLPQGMYGDKPADSSQVQEFFSGGAKGGSGTWTPAQLVWNNVTRGYAIRDVYNGVQLITVDKIIPSIHLMFQDTNKASLEKPESPGYLGFFKPFRQKDGIFEGPGPAFAYFNKLTSLLYNPPLTVKFETYGRTTLRPAQIIKLDGQNYRLVNVNLRMDASKNEFWASCEGEWFTLKKKTEEGITDKITSTDQIWAGDDLKTQPKNFNFGIDSSNNTGKSYA